jgi:hypothetical protein
MFYEPERRKQLAAIMETFDNRSVVIIVGSVNENDEEIDFNIISKLPPMISVEAVIGFMEHYKEHHIDKIEEMIKEEAKSHLKIVD